MFWTFSVFLFVLLACAVKTSLLEGISGVVIVIDNRSDLADRIKNLEKGRLLFIAFTGKVDHLIKSDIALFMAIHEALFDKNLAADFFVYSGPISDAMENQYSLHTFALPKVIVSQGPGKHLDDDGGKPAVHVDRWIKRFRRTETDL